MTNIAPNLQNPSPPTFPEVLELLKRDILKNINCVRPGVVQSYNVGGANQPPTATIEIAQKQVTSILADGSRTLSDYPVLVSVPVYFAGGGRYVSTYPINEGDECILLFNDRELDNWLAQGPGQAPTTGRFHDLSDAFALVGIKSGPNAITNVSATAMQTRSIDYTGPDGEGELIELTQGKISIIADEVVVHSRLKGTFDSGGTGFVYTPAQIDTYTDGVPANHHAPTPPEVPT